MRWLLAAFVLTASLSSAGADTNRISQGQAAKVALVRVPGTVVHEKLKKGKKKHHEHDHWNIKIAPRDHAKTGYVRKVEVDAETGEILKVKDVKAKSED
jgi:uncharacterized membrane protein YkoI